MPCKVRTRSCALGQLIVPPATSVPLRWKEEDEIGLIKSAALSSPVESRSAEPWVNKSHVTRVQEGNRRQSVSETAAVKIPPIGSRATPVMDELIQELDDSQAVRVVRAFAGGRLRAGGVAETEWTPEIEQVLREAFPDAAIAATAAGPTGTVSEGDLARDAVRLLADDPDYREAVAFLSGIPPEAEIVPGIGTIALIAATLVVLQTYVLFERDPDGKIHVKIEKQPTGEGLLKALVDAMLRFAAKV
jgi:hypothetical protein